VWLRYRHCPRRPQRQFVKWRNLELDTLITYLYLKVCGDAHHNRLYPDPGDELPEPGPRDGGARGTQALHMEK